jgi:hypothetical protein
MICVCASAETPPAASDALISLKYTVKTSSRVDQAILYVPEMPLSFDCSIPLCEARSLKIDLVLQKRFDLFQVQSVLVPQSRNILFQPSDSVFETLGLGREALPDGCISSAHASDDHQA